MKLTIKRKVGRKWEGVPAAEVVGTSLCEWIMKSSDDVVACLMEDDKEIAFVTNNRDYASQYSSRAFSLYANDLWEVLGERNELGVLISVFPEATLTEVNIERETI